MPIRVVHGNLFESGCQTLVNPVNCKGFMGKGLAKEFRKLSKPAFEAYKEKCEAGGIQPGSPFFLFDLANGRRILHFPTKRHWRAKSKLEDIRAGLELLRREYDELGITGLAMPALGCGLGGLSWEKEVGPLVEEQLGDLPIEVEVYLGKGAADRTQVMGQGSLDFGQG